MAVDPLPGQWRAPLSLLCFLGLLALTAHGAEAKRSFDIPSDAAEKSLAMFAKQSGVEVLFSTEAAAGIRTEAIKGEIVPLEALQFMLAGTPLVIVRDDKNGVLRITKGVPVNPKAQGRALAAAGSVRPEEAGKSATPIEEAVLMSPFEVVTDNKGYYASTTMSGTRFNSKLEDLASSMTVITKEQMQDFGMIAVNDVFLYTAGAEGAGSYTSFAIDRNGSVSDDVQLNPTQANRVRGLGPANTSFGNFQTTGRVPLDPISIDAVEVSRGPNANVFGLGSPSGTVNQVPASASLGRKQDQLRIRGDSYGGYRASLDINRVLKPGVLAVRGQVVYQHDGFVRKPSGMNTERYNGMLKYRPFSKTQITASVSAYHSYGNRPNFTTPRDNISYWLQSGKPTWDPVTQTVHVIGSTLGPFSASTYNGPDYFTPTVTGLNTKSQLFVDSGGVGYWSAPSTYSNVNGPTSGAQTTRVMYTNSSPGVSGGRISNQPLFTTTPAVHDKSLYDWTSINLAAVNREWTRALTSDIKIDQELLATNRQQLAVQLAAFQEDTMVYQRFHVGIANINGQSGNLFIDVNERNLDGTPNPYFLQGALKDEFEDLI